MFLESERHVRPMCGPTIVPSGSRMLRALPAVTAARCTRRHDIARVRRYGSRSPRWPGRTVNPQLRLASTCRERVCSRSLPWCAFVFGGKCGKWFGCEVRHDTSDPRSVHGGKAKRAAGVRAAARGLHGRSASLYLPACTTAAVTSGWRASSRSSSSSIRMPSSRSKSGRRSRPAAMAGRIGRSGASCRTLEWTAQTLRPGDQVIVVGSPARREANRLYLARLDRPADGYSFEQVRGRPRLRSPGRP